MAAAKKAKHKSGYFTKSGANDYVSPSGQHFDLAQVQLFYVNKGKFPGQSAKSVKAGWKVAHQRGTRAATQGKSL
jgi:hypothetical protein